MVLVPPDAAIRMRAQVESELRSPVQQLQPLRGIPAELPAMQRGQTFTAQIREVLPDNTYRALVAGKQLTLQLPEGAKAGDELELVVVDRSGRVIIARQAEGGNAPAGSSAPYPFAKFSAAARLIGQLLPAEGEAPPPAQLNRGQPLLAQPPQAQNAAALLAPALGKAVAQSGLFYEAHQAQWVSGRLPLTQLLQEPQGQHSAPAAFQHAAAEKVGAGGTALAGAPRDIETPPAGSPRNMETASAQSPGLAQRVADDLRPLVQQQLEAAAANRMAWHGEVWPRQTMDWQIEWEGERAADGSSDEEARWRTALSLTTPRLGRIDAQLQLSARGVSIALATPSDSSANDLRAAAPALVEALSAAGVPLLDIKVRFENEYPAGEG